MTALITQSNYIPWKGYFDNIALADVFVIYDDMQYTKRDWRSRNKVKSDAGLKWLSIPVEVKGKFHQKINETKVSDKGWNKSHLNTILNYYRTAPCFKENKEWLEALFMNCDSLWLTEINRYFIEQIMMYLDVQCEIKDSREFTLVEGKTEKLVSICEQVNASNYITGLAAKDYMNENLFTERGINVHYSDYSGYEEYPQLNPPFEHGVTILDLILNVGKKTRNYLKHSKLSTHG